MEHLPPRLTGMSALLPQCSDLRFFYTGSELTSVLSGLDPLDPRIAQEFSAENPGSFTAEDLSALQSQLEHERAFLNNVNSYKQLSDLLFVEGSNAIALELTNAATQVAVGLNDSLPDTISSNPVPESKLDIASSYINDAAAVLSFVGPVGDILAGADGAVKVAAAFSKTAAVGAGLTWTASGILQTLSGGASPSVSLNDGLVRTFGDLLSTTSNAASSAALSYAENLEESNGAFYDSVFSDWHKLETIGLLTANPAAQGWYNEDVGTTATQQQPTVLVSARSMFYQQLLPQLFVKDTFPGLFGDSGSGKPLTQLITTCWGPNSISSTNTLGYTGPTVYDNLYEAWSSGIPELFSTSAAEASYGESAALSGSLDVAWVSVNLPAVVSGTGSQYAAIGWSSEVGAALFAPPNSATTDGTGSLNLPGNLLYYTNELLPDNFLGCPYSPNVLGSSNFNPVDLTTTGSGSVGSPTSVTVTGQFDGSGNLDLYLSAHLQTYVVSSGVFSIVSGSKRFAGAVGRLDATGKVSTALLVLPASALPQANFTLQATYSGDTKNPSGASSVMSFTPAVPQVSLSITAPTLSIPSGDQSQFQLDLVSLHGYVGEVDLSCSLAADTGTSSESLPTCTLAQPVVQMTAGQTLTTQLTVAATSGQANDRVRQWVSGSAAVALMSFCVLVPRRRRRSWATLTSFVSVALLVTGGVAGCAGGPKPAPQPSPTRINGSYTVTVRAKAGGQVQTASVGVTITDGEGAARHLRSESCYVKINRRPEEHKFWSLCPGTLS